MENYRTARNISTLQSLIKEYNSLLDEFAQAQIKSGKKLKTLQKVSNDFLNRTRINNEGLLPLLENYKTQISAIQPIGLLVRSILSDFLTFCYLATFSDGMDVEEVSIQNELDLLERDFLRSMLEVIEIESKINQYNKNIPLEFEDREEYEAQIRDLKDRFKHLFINDKSDLRLKKPKEFRATSFQTFFHSKEEFATAPPFMTEKYKWERMIKRGFSKYVTVFTAFKFFSQFQHYSPMSMELARKETEPYAFFHLIMAIDAIIIVTDMQIQIIDGKGSDYLPRLRKIEDSVSDIFSNNSDKTNN